MEILAKIVGYIIGAVIGLVCGRLIVHGIYFIVGAIL